MANIAEMDRRTNDVLTQITGNSTRFRQTGGKTGK